MARNLTDIVDIVFVSDHGMVDTTTFTNIYIDKILGEDGMQAIEHVDGGPAIGIRFRKGSNESLYLSRLYEATKQQQFDVFTHETMPRRWHFSNNARIAPIYMVPKADHVLTTVEEGNKTGNPGVSDFLLLCNFETQRFDRTTALTILKRPCKLSLLLMGHLLLWLRRYISQSRGDDRSPGRTRVGTRLRTIHT